MEHLASMHEVLGFSSSSKSTHNDNNSNNKFIKFFKPCVTIGRSKSRVTPISHFF